MTAVVVDLTTERLARAVAAIRGVDWSVITDYRRSVYRAFAQRQIAQAQEDREVLAAIAAEPA